MYCEEDIQEPEAPEPKEPEIWTTFHIHQDGAGVSVDFATNDDNDDGYPDPEVVRATYHPRDLEGALKLTGKSRTGIYGHQVSVFLNGEKI